MNQTNSQNRWLKAKEVIRFMSKRMGEYRLSQVAGSLSFTSVLSIVPLVIVMLSILTIFPVFDTFKGLIQQFMLDNLMPEKMSKLVMSQITLFAENSSHLSLVSLILMIFSALMTIGTVDRVFNDIWRVKKRGLVRKNILVYWAVLTMGPILFGSVLLLGSYFIGTLKSMPVLSTFLSVFLPLISSMLGFFALYTFVPNRKVMWRDAFVGALVAGLLFIVLTKGFTWVFKQVQVYAVVYSAFSIVPAFFLWLYVFWFIVLLGASLAATLPIFKYERWRKEHKPGDTLPDALMVLYVLYQVQNSPSHMASWSSLQTQLRLSSEELSFILNKLQTQGWVGKVKRMDGGTGWALICNLDEVKLVHLYDVFVFDSQYFSGQAQKINLPWAKSFINIHKTPNHQVCLSELFENR